MSFVFNLWINSSLSCQIWISPFSHVREPKFYHGSFVFNLLVNSSFSCQIWISPFSHVREPQFYHGSFVFNLLLNSSFSCQIWISSFSHTFSAISNYQTKQFQIYNFTHMISHYTDSQIQCSIDFSLYGLQISLYTDFKYNLPLISLYTDSGRMQQTNTTANNTQY